MDLRKRGKKIFAFYFFLCVQIAEAKPHGFHLKSGEAQQSSPRQLWQVDHPQRQKSPHPDRRLHRLHPRFQRDSQQGVVNYGTIHCSVGDIFLIRF